MFSSKVEYSTHHTGRHRGNSGPALVEGHGNPEGLARILGQRKQHHRAYSNSAHRVFVPSLDRRRGTDSHQRCNPLDPVSSESRELSRTAGVAPLMKVHRRNLQQRIVSKNLRLTCT